MHASAVNSEREIASGRSWSRSGFSGWPDRRKVEGTSYRAPYIQVGDPSWLGTGTDKVQLPGPYVANRGSDLQLSGVHMRAPPSELVAWSLAQSDFSGLRLIQSQSDDLRSTTASQSDFSSLRSLHAGTAYLGPANGGLGIMASPCAVVLLINP